MSEPQTPEPEGSTPTGDSVDQPTDQTADATVEQPGEQPIAPAPAAPSYAGPPATPWRERVLGAKGVAAVAVGALLVGGLGGFALGRVVHHDRGDWRQGGPGWHGGPGGQFGGQFGPRGQVGPPGGPGGRGWGQGQTPEQGQDPTGGNGRGPTG